GEASTCDFRTCKAPTIDRGQQTGYLQRASLYPEYRWRQTNTSGVAVFPTNPCHAKAYIPPSNDRKTSAKAAYSTAVAIMQSSAPTSGIRQDHTTKITSDPLVSIVTSRIIWANDVRPQRKTPAA